MVMNTMVKKNGKNITKQKKQEEDIQKFQTSQTPSPPVVLSIVFFWFLFVLGLFPSPHGDQISSAKVAKVIAAPHGIPSSSSGGGVLACQPGPPATPDS